MSASAAVSAASANKQLKALGDLANQGSASSVTADPPVSGKGKTFQSSEPAEDPRELFREFVGETLFGQMLASMHSTHDKAAYFHGGHAEEVFQKQLDQQMVQEMTESSADKFADPMFDLFQLQRR